MNDVFFSVIVPVYNVSEYLEKCIDSIISQNFENFEIILVNDGSTDNSAEICEKYVKRSKRIKYCYKENGGLSSARNFGIEKSAGDYLLFIDSDDFLTDSGFLARIYALIKNNICDFVMYLPEEYNGNLSQRIKTHYPICPFLNQTVNARNAIDYIYGEDCYNTMAQTKVIRKKYLLENELFFKPGIFHEDDEWIARTLLSYPDVVISDITGYGYRHREDSIISTKNERKIFKKCCDRISISDEILSAADILKHKTCLTHFAYYYMQSFKDAKNCPTYIDEFMDIANGLSVIDKMKYSLSKRHRLFYYYKRVFGIKSANALILKTAQNNP